MRGVVFIHRPGREEFVVYEDGAGVARRVVNELLDEEIIARVFRQLRADALDDAFFCLAESDPPIDEDAAGFGDGVVTRADAIPRA